MSSVWGLDIWEMFCAGWRCVSRCELRALGQSHKTPVTEQNHGAGSLCHPTAARSLAAEIPSPAGTGPLPCPGASIPRARVPVKQRPSVSERCAGCEWGQWCAVGVVSVAPVDMVRLKSCKISCNVWASVVKTQDTGTEVKEEKA